MAKDLSREQRIQGRDRKLTVPFTNDCGIGNDKMSILSHYRDEKTHISQIGRNEYYSTVILNSDIAT